MLKPIEAHLNPPTPNSPHTFLFSNFYIYSFIVLSLIQPFQFFKCTHVFSISKSFLLLLTNSTDSDRVELMIVKNYCIYLSAPFMSSNNYIQLYIDCFACFIIPCIYTVHYKYTCQVLVCIHAYVATPPQPNWLYEYSITLHGLPSNQRAQGPDQQLPFEDHLRLAGAWRRNVHPDMLFLKTLRKLKHTVKFLKTVRMLPPCCHKFF